VAKRTLLIFLLVLLLSLAGARTLPPAVAAHIDGFVTERMAAWDTPGMSLLVVLDDEVVYSRGYGFADREAERPMTEDTLVVLGSTTKAMTALAVMQLVEAGRIELDAPVTRYLPWFRTADGRGGEITVRHLMSHSSGFPWGILFTGRESYPAEMEAYVRWLSRVRLEAAPGERYGYSNDTFVILGLIVQEVSGMAYETYMYENVFGPLEMNRTTFDIPTAEARGLARGYRNEYGVAKPFDVPFVPSENAAGKLMTSVSDLGNYFLMLLGRGRFGDHRLISEASLEEMWTPVVPVDDHTSYCLAWYSIEAGPIDFVSHPGSVRNSGSRFILAPEARLGVGVLSNISRPLDPRNEVAEGVAVATLLFGDHPLETAAPPADASAMDPAALDKLDELDRIVGEYGSAAGPVRIFREGMELLGWVYGQEFELHPYRENAFILRSDFSRLDGLVLEYQPADRSAQAWLAGNDGLALMGQWFAFRKS
jgi:CubicO group peptidase (beta-lactamase class C family)